MHRHAARRATGEGVDAGTSVMSVAAALNLPVAVGHRSRAFVLRPGLRVRIGVAPWQTTCFLQG
jgi:hypothetical protein